MVGGWDEVEIDEARQAWAVANYEEAAQEIDEILVQRRRIPGPWPATPGSIGSE